MKSTYNHPNYSNLDWKYSESNLQNLLNPQYLRVVNIPL